jgi:hypothetical protein
MKREKMNPNKRPDVGKDNEIQIPDDSLKPIKEGSEEQPEVYLISKGSKALNRKNFFKSAASVAGLAALGNVLKSCEESYFYIEKTGDNCTCHAVCSCNVDVGDGNKFRYDKGNEYISKYDTNKNCTCDTVCTCNSICSCDSVCPCDFHDTNTYTYTYFYPS